MSPHRRNLTRLTRAYLFRRRARKWWRTVFPRPMSNDPRAYRRYYLKTALLIAGGVLVLALVVWALSLGGSTETVPSEVLGNG